MNILQQICEQTRIRVERNKAIVSLSEIEQRALALPKGGFAFENALRGEGISFICEIKRASPSKGIIAEEFDYLQIAQDYTEAGAAAISVLTEPDWFKGADSYLSEISSRVETPLLRKDFTIDEYMIYEAKCIGASAILLICAVIDRDTLTRYIQLADALGLCALVETHDETEIETALAAGARIVGVNNRNLKTFEVDISLSEQLRRRVPPELVFVAESGITTREEVARLQSVGVDAVLIGEKIMRSVDKKIAIAELKG
ncbi:MAG: indole-3-glycerol phosphate synthase TrpC [Oscillospiraceae bacterium]|nr:indole-3-glycerol phosphate synthase TrpC [Oscillospiraceae bacterium]